MSKRNVRVAVTGAGVKTPAGTDLKTMLDTVLAARSTAARVDSLTDAGVLPSFACLVPEFDLTPYLSLREQRQLDRPTLLALCAALDAFRAAGLPEGGAPDRMGVAVGTGMGGLGTAEIVVRAHGDDPGKVPAFTVPRIMASSPAARIAMKIGARGACLTYATACASGATAIGESVHKIRSGALDVVVAGGVDAAVTPVAMSSFARMGALSQRHNDPGAACRPFDADRDGFVMGEGAAFLVLERWDHAVARGATIIGEVLGYGTTCDAFHIVAPTEDGSEAARCVREAIDDAGLSVTDIGHVNAHGTSTVLNDRAEARALHAVFGDRCPPVTASKGVLGHLVGGAGAAEAVISLLCAATGEVPPVANFTRADDPGLIDIVSGTARRIPTGYVASNSFGFGGVNACLVFGPGQESGV